jgi:sialate O-acetylesterase
MLVVACRTMPCRANELAAPGTLTLHAIFDSDMVLQRGKPITIWGWAAPGTTVSVRLGNDQGRR